MDLKIKDVAELLNVSESTIRRWLSEGKIPAYRLNSQYRFSLIEIEEWVMKQKMGNDQEAAPFSAKAVLKEDATPTSKTGLKQFSLFRALHKGCIIKDVPGTTKEAVIKAAVRKFARDLNLDADVVTELLLDRETLMPTALNHGFAVPHTRDFLLSTDTICVVFPSKPIEYGALDNQPVHTLFFLFASDEKRHLHLLAKIAHLASSPETQKLLKSKPSKETLLNHIKVWESSISSAL
jgi:PTS system nitrogen regulatory IIA component